MCPAERACCERSWEEGQMNNRVAHSGHSLEYRQKSDLMIPSHMIPSPENIIRDLIDKTEGYQ